MVLNHLVFLFMKYRLHFNLLCITSSKKGPIICEKWDFPPTIHHPSRYVSFPLPFHPLTHILKSEGPVFIHTDRICILKSAYASRTKFRNIMKYLVPRTTLVGLPVSSPPIISFTLQCCLGVLCI